MVTLMPGHYVRVLPSGAKTFAVIVGLLLTVAVAVVGASYASNGVTHDAL